MLNTMRHMPIFNYRAYENRTVHIVGCNGAAEHVAYLVAKLGCPLITLYGLDDYQIQLLHELAKKLARFTENTPTVKMYEPDNESAHSFQDIVFMVDTDLESRGRMYDEVFSMSLDTEVIFDLRFDSTNYPKLTTITPDTMYDADDLQMPEFSTIWGMLDDNPISSRLLAIFGVNQFITWSQIRFEIEGRANRNVELIQQIKPLFKNIPTSPLMNPLATEFQNLLDEPITVIGAGASGSHLVAILVECGFTNIEVYDYDRIDDHNIPNQWYFEDQVEQYKVFALKENILDEYNQQIKVHIERVEKDQKLNSIVFLLTDTMESRKEINENILRDSDSVEVIVETRMGAEKAQVYLVDRDHHDNQRRWEETLFDTTQFKPELSACGTGITVGTTAMLTAVFAVNHLLHNHLQKSRSQNHYMTIMLSMYPPHLALTDEMN